MAWIPLIMRDRNNLLVVPKINPVTGIWIQPQRDFYYSYRVVARMNDLRNLIVPEKLHNKIIKSFHEKIVEKIYKKLYVFKMPFGIGDLCVGEEINKRKYARVYEKQPNNKCIAKLVPNIGRKKVFRFWWNKDTCKFKNSTMYWLKIADEHRCAIGKYIEERNSNPELKNYRAHLIY